MSGGSDHALAVELLQTIIAPHELVSGYSTQQWSHPTAVVSAAIGEHVDIYDREHILGGRAEPVRRILLPPMAAASVTPDGDITIVADLTGIRATASGTQIWRIDHDAWRTRGVAHPATPARAAVPPAVSSDGRYTSVVVPVTEQRPSQPHATLWSTWLLLDTVSGAVLARHRLGVQESEVTQCWQREGRRLAISAWTSWQSWVTTWIDLDDERPLPRRILSYREVTDVLTPTRVLSVRRAEEIAVDDDRAEIAVHEVPASGNAEDGEIAVLDVLHLTAGEDGHPADARRLDDDHILVSSAIAPRYRMDSARHWLCSAHDLQPLGYLAYPYAVGPGIAPLPDGTWLTHDPIGHRTCIRRWARSRA